MIVQRSCGGRHLTHVSDPHEVTLYVFVDDATGGLAHDLDVAHPGSCSGEPGDCPIAEYLELYGTAEYVERYGTTEEFDEGFPALRRLREGDSVPVGETSRWVVVSRDIDFHPAREPEIDFRFDWIT